MLPAPVERRWLDCGGYSLVGTGGRPYAGSNGNNPAMSVVPKSGNSGLNATIRSFHQMSPNAIGNEIKLLYIWGFGTNGTGGEQYPTNGGTIKAGVEFPNASSPNTQNGARTPVYAALNRSFSIAGGGGAAAVVLTDAVHMPALGSIGGFFVNTCVTVANSTDTVPMSGALSGGSKTTGSGGGYGLGEGDDFGDLVDSGSVGNHVNRSPSFYPSAILVRTSEPKGGMGILGTSRSNGTGDVGGNKGVGLGGTMERIMWNQPNLAYDFTRSPVGGTIKLSIPGATSAQWLADHAMRLEALRLSGANMVCDDYGINDGVSDDASFTQWKINRIAIIKSYAAMGIITIVRTQIPPTDSTDGWLTTINQTPRSGYTYVARMNQWARARGGDSLIGACLAAGIPLNMVYVFDEAAAVEVNQNNVLTQDGGYILASGATTPAAASDTMVLTANGSGLTLTDTSKSWTLRQWKGYEAVVRTGTKAYLNCDINDNTTAGVLSLTSNVLAGCLTGDHIDLRNDLMTGDGLHLTGAGCCKSVAWWNGAGFPDRLLPVWQRLTR